MNFDIVCQFIGTKQVRVKHVIANIQVDGHPVIGYESIANTDVPGEMVIIGKHGIANTGNDIQLKWLPGFCQISRMLHKKQP